jgi:hypothetical protein
MPRDGYPQLRPAQELRLRPRACVRSPPRCGGRDSAALSVLRAQPSIHATRETSLRSYEGRRVAPGALERGQTQSSAVERPRTDVSSPRGSACWNDDPDKALAGRCPPASPATHAGGPRPLDDRLQLAHVPSQLSTSSIVSSIAIASRVTAWIFSPSPSPRFAATCSTSSAMSFRRARSGGTRAPRTRAGSKHPRGRSFAPSQTQDPVGRRDHAHIHAYALTRPRAPSSSVRRNRRSIAWSIRRQLADLV